MSGYTPKVGDKVRAMLGESVIAGEVVVTVNNGEIFDIALGDPRDSVVRLFDAEGWHFEQIVEVPTKFGAVIRRADGAVFSLIDLGDRHYLLPWWERGEAWSSTERATAGGFTVLFEGVDE